MMVSRCSSCGTTRRSQMNTAKLWTGAVRRCVPVAASLRIIDRLPQDIRTANAMDDLLVLTWWLVRRFIYREASTSISTASVGLVYFVQKPAPMGKIITTKSPVGAQLSPCSMADQSPTSQCRFICDTSPSVRRISAT